MITISKIPDGKIWADAIAQYRSKGMRTNFYAAAEEFLPQLQWLSELKFDGGCSMKRKNRLTCISFWSRGERRSKSLYLTSLYFWSRSV